jgi:hypothetical protein
VKFTHIPHFPFFFFKVLTSQTGYRTSLITFASWSLCTSASLPSLFLHTFFWVFAFSGLSSHLFRGYARWCFCEHLAGL